MHVKHISVQCCLSVHQVSTCHCFVLFSAPLHILYNMCFSFCQLNLTLLVSDKLCCFHLHKEIWKHMWVVNCVYKQYFYWPMTFTCRASWVICLPVSITCPQNKHFEGQRFLFWLPVWLMWSVHSLPDMVSRVAAQWENMRPNKTNYACFKLLENDWHL